MMDTVHFYRPIQDGGPQPEERDPFESILSEFWILDGGRIPWPAYTAKLDPMFVGLPSKLLVYFQPWWPGVESKKLSFRRHIDGVIHDVDDKILVTGNPSQTMSRIFTAREACGGERSGLWLLMTTCDDADAVATNIISSKPFGSPLQIAMAFRDEISAALALDEGAWGTLILRRNHPAGQILLDLVSSMHLPGS